MRNLKRFMFFLGLMTLLLVGSSSSRAQGPVNLALNKPALASAIENNDPANLGPQRAVDGDMGTRWAAGAGGEQWWAVDLGAATSFRQIRLFWEAAYAAGYEIRVSNDPLPSDAAEVDISTFTSVATLEEQNGGTDIIPIPAGTSARTVAVVMLAQGPHATYSLWEAQIFAEAASLTGTVSGPNGVLANAVVTVNSGTDSFTTRTDEQGQYTFEGLFPGDYSVRAYAPGQFAPETQSGTLANGQTATQNFTLDTPVTLTTFSFPFFTADWIAIEGVENDFSTNIFDTAYAAESLPTTNPTTVNGIPFSLGPRTSGANNVYAVSGATFRLPRGNYTAIHTLDSSAGGIYVGSATLTYEDGTSESVPFSVSDWFGNPVAGEQRGIDVSYRINPAGEQANVGSDIKIFQYSLFPDPSKVLDSVSFSAPAAGSSTTTKPYLFAMTLETTAALPATGTISGQITSPQGALPGATVRVGPYEVTTDASGNYSVPGLAAGEYTVTAFKTGQFAPVSQTVTVTPGGTHTVNLALSATPQFFTYPLAYTHDWASSHENPGDYFAADTAYPAVGDETGSGLPEAGPFTPEGVGVTFQFPSTADGARNVILVNGQTMPIPPARYSALYLLEACGWGSVNAPIVLTYADGTTENVRATFTDWFGNPSTKEKVAYIVNHRHSATDPNNASGSQIKIFAETLPVNSTKVLRSITLPKDPAGYTTQTAFLWALTLEAIETPQTGTVSGTITGPGGPVANATVSLGGFGQVTTNAQGQFTLTNAPAGAHNLNVIAPSTANLNAGTTSVNVTSGQTATADVALTAGPTQVFSSLGAANFEQGLRQLQDPSVGNSATTVVTEAGQTARRFTGRLYFDVADSFLYQNTEVTPIYVQVEYLDRGEDTFRLRYNSSSVTISDYGPKYARTTEELTVTKGDTGTWQKVLFTIEDAGFYNGVELGADFFIEAQSGAEVVKSVIVSRTETIQPLPVPTGCKGNADLSNNTIDINDAVTVLQHAVQIITLTGTALENADVNGVDGVNITDAILTLQAAVGIPVPQIPSTTCP